MGQLIKCRICKLDRARCKMVCLEMEDVTSLCVESTDEKKEEPEKWCTAHQCQYNSGGFRCVLNECAWGFDKMGEKERNHEELL